MHMMDWRMGGGHSDFRSVMSIPMPLAMFGVVTGFMLGMLLGVMKGKQAGMMMSGGHGMHAKKMWKKMHHHHGYGMPACCAEHGEGWGGQGQMMMAGKGHEEERNEGE